jgi:4-carboxymuconolactone decarboxylase
MTTVTSDARTLESLDAPTRELARLAAVVTAGRNEDVRQAIAVAAALVPPIWIEELILQSYLFAGFPRTLNAMREWRRIRPQPVTPAIASDPGGTRGAGERTCAAVYGPMYDRLRQNIRRLHPALDEWMILEGYGKVLSRPGLDLARRELCIVAACAAGEQDRQLHSHLHGALNVGVAARVIDELIDALFDVVSHERVRAMRLLWARVQGK